MRDTVLCHILLLLSGSGRWSVVAKPGNDDYRKCVLSVPIPADKDSQEKKSSHRTRRKRDPVTSRMLFFLDSGHFDAVGIPE
jgi:hypothetical protein